MPETPFTVEKCNGEIVPVQKTRKRKGRRFDLWKYSVMNEVRPRKFPLKWQVQGGRSKKVEELRFLFLKFNLWNEREEFELRPYRLRRGVLIKKVPKAIFS